MIKQLYAYKSHMEQAFVGGKRVPVTCLIVPEHSVINPSIKDAVALISIDKVKSVNKPLQGLLKKLKLELSPRFLREVALSAPLAENTSTLDPATLLTEGLVIKVTSISKGKGMSGVIKRWGFSTQPRTHGQSDRHRAPGSIARGTTPGRIVKGKKMGGRMGGDTKTVSNLKVLSFDATTRLLKVMGPIPGARKTLTKITLPQ